MLTFLLFQMVAGNWSMVRTVESTFQIGGPRTSPQNQERCLMSARLLKSIPWRNISYSWFWQTRLSLLSRWRPLRWWKVKTPCPSGPRKFKAMPTSSRPALVLVAIWCALSRLLLFRQLSRSMSRWTTWLRERRSPLLVRCSRVDKTHSSHSRFVYSFIFLNRLYH